MSCVPAKEVVAAKRAREAALNASLAGATGAAAAGGWWPKCNPEKRLPCFLEFAEYDIPRSDSSNMRCFPVRRKPQAEAQVDCRTGSAFGLLDDAVQAEQQQWDLSPSYYQYANCRCLSGFREVWTRNGTHLACEANPKSQPLPPWAWVFVALGAVLAVLAAAILSLGSRLVLFRTRWAREMELKRKRARGSPKGGGTISVVVTDIEGYSGGEVTHRSRPAELAAARAHLPVSRVARPCSQCEKGRAHVTRARLTMAERACLEWPPC
jgi:hypothetical protein